jgi:hypothetical protein
VGMATTHDACSFLFLMLAAPTIPFFTFFGTLCDDMVDGSTTVLCDR